MGMLRSLDGPRRCFLSTPFTPDFQPVRHQLAQMLENMGLEVPRVETLSSQRSISERARDVLRSCHFVIADLTQSNPSVIYELGFAQGLGLPVLILTQDLDSAPHTMLQNNLFLVYESNHLDRIEGKIAHWIARARASGGSR